MARNDQLLNFSPQLACRCYLCMKGMPKAQMTKPRPRSEAEILDQATRQLLKSVKEVAKKKGRSVSEESMRREGYSERFIEKVRKV